MAKDNQNKCCKRVKSGAWHSSQCQNPANMTHGGNHYCGIHDPIRLKKKRDAQKKARAKQRAEQESQKRLEDAAPEMLKLLKIAVENCKFPDYRLSPEWFIEAEPLVCKVEDRDIFGREEGK